MGKNLRLGAAFFWTIVLMLTFSCLSRAQVNITTWQDDNLRTGQNLNETILTPANLSTGNFGELCSLALDGQVYAQPLVLSNVTFNGTQYASLVYVVTQRNTLYVINGTPQAQGNPCVQVASLSLTPSGQFPVDCNYIGAQGCQTIAPVVGTLGTPVIQTVANSNGTIYVVTETQDVATGMPKNWYHYLHAVSLDTLTESVSPVLVRPPVGVWFETQISAWSRRHIQRPGLLLANNNFLYIGFSMMDGTLPLYNGSIFRYDTTNLNATPMYFATTPDTARAGGGVWQGGAGLAYGPDGSSNDYLYFNTGNGDWDASINWGDSFIKLDPNSMKPAGYFTTADQNYRNCGNNDVDFGSGGVMLTPATSNWPNIALSGDKEGGIWIMDRANPGGFNQGQCPSDCTACSTAVQSQSNLNLQTVWLGAGTGPAVHNNLAYWNNFVYIAPVNKSISQYQICNDQGSGLPLCGSPVNATGPGGISVTTPYGVTPTISASGQSTNGVLWVLSGDFAAQSTRPGRLYAFDAAAMTGSYVNTGTGSFCQNIDVIAPVTKFSVPTIANGFVYFGTQALVNGVNNGTGTFYIFGLNRQCNKTKAKGPIAKAKAVK